jgi:hypothetical protein
MDVMDIEAVADELYGLLLEDFIPTRSAREKEANGDGDKALAAEIHRLSKPNTVAWLVNRLVRQHNGDIQTLLALGSAMREATAAFSGDRLRELSRQQHEVTRGLVQQAEELADAGGRQVSAAAARSLEETFYAALADSSAADAIAAGRLTTGLQSTGLSTLQSTSQTRTHATTESPPTVKGRRGTKEGQVSDRRESSEAKVVRTMAALDAAKQEREDTDATLQRAERALADASNRVEQCRRQLNEALEGQSKARLDRRQAKAAFDRADRRAKDAQRRLTDEAEPES